MNINCITYIILFLSVYFGFFVGDTALFYVILEALLIVTNFLSNSSRKIVTRKNISVIFVVLICFILSFLFSEYSQNFTILNFILLFCLFGVISRDDIEADYPELFGNIFYYSLLFFLLFSFLKAYIFDAEEITFTTLSDANYVGVFVFLFFLLSNKMGKISGVILGIVYAFVFNGSRSYLLLMILFYCFRLFSSRIDSFIKKYNIGFRKIIFALFLASVLLSLIWTFIISANGTTAWHESLNDLSNRMRFVANVYAFLQFGNIKSWFFGYGFSIMDALGITGSADVVYYTRNFLGVKLVQPHNSYINLLLRMGIIPGICYLSVFGDILSRTKANTNIAYYLPYLIDAMFMHSFFNGKWLILYIIIIILPQKHFHIPLLRGNFNFKKRTRKREIIQ